MSLFSSPAIRVFNSENSESMIQRKPGGTNTLLPRKPFVDKTVNCNTPTPNSNKKQKSNLAIKEPVKRASPTVKTPNLEINPEDYFSYQEMEDCYEDIFPHFKCLENHDVYSILKNYLDNSTPPPSPTSMKTLFDKPMLVNSLESSFSSNKSYDDMFFDLPEQNDFMLKTEDEIDLPEFIIDDL